MLSHSDLETVVVHVHLKVENSYGLEIIISVLKIQTEGQLHTVMNGICITIVVFLKKITLSEIAKNERTRTVTDFI